MLCQGWQARADCPGPAGDTSNDLSLECLIGTAAHLQANNYVPSILEQTNYRSLISELSGVLALPVVEPADTLGFSGFHFSFDSHVTSISNGAPYFTGSQAGVRNVSGSTLGVIGIMLRKGVWLPLPPLPSVEVGIGASNLLQSGIYGVNGYLRLAIHEGYHHLPLPSIALRAAVTRIAGASEVDLTLITADGVLSKAFGVGGTFTLEPYLGGGALFSIARSQVIDTAPTIDLYRGPIPGPGVPNFTDPGIRLAALNQKITFPNLDTIYRWRAFVGLQIHYAILAITVGFTVLGAGVDHGTALSQGCVNTNNGCPAKPLDQANFQFQGNISAGLRF